jgi:hypothetical protein
MGIYGIASISALLLLRIYPVSKIIFQSIDCHCGHALHFRFTEQISKAEIFVGSVQRITA